MIYIVLNFEVCTAIFPTSLCSTSPLVDIVVYACCMRGGVVLLSIDSESLSIDNREHCAEDSEANRQYRHHHHHQLTTPLSLSNPPRN